MVRSDNFKIFNVKNALTTFECERLIKLYNDEQIEFINEFYGFDVEYIIKKVEDVTYELTNLDIINQEPIYLAKSSPIGIEEPIRADAWEDNTDPTKQYGNRLFTTLIFLTPGEITFPNINLKHQCNIGDGLVWNNVITQGRTLESINQISNDTYYIKKWTRENPFV
jgi:hypothetical protein